MDFFNISFAKIILLQEDIAEVIINNDVEMDLAMVDKYHEFLIAHLQAPFSLLINKIHRYTYTFEAQKKLGTIAQIKAMAVVAYNHTTEVSTQSLASLPRDTRWNLQLFYDRSQALQWLEAEQKKITTKPASREYQLSC